MSPTCANTSWQSLSPLANSQQRLPAVRSTPDFNQSLFKFVQIIDLTPVLYKHAWRSTSGSRPGSSQGCLPMKLEVSRRCSWMVLQARWADVLSASA